MSFCVVSHMILQNCRFEHLAAKKCNHSKILFLVLFRFKMPCSPRVTVIVSAIVIAMSIAMAIAMSIAINISIVQGDFFSSASPSNVLV